MLRLLFWILLFYVGWKVLSPLIAPPKRTPRRSENPPKAPTPPFQDVEEAKFEDVTSKPTSDPKSSTSN